MNINTNDELINYLNTFKDEKYLEFNKKIVNSNMPMLGVRTPIIKDFVRKNSINYLYKILNIIDNYYYEETLLEGYIIAKIKDIDLFDKYLKKFISKIDNWAVCDMCIGAMKQMKNNNKYFDLAINYIKTDDEFNKRVGYVIILNHFLDDEHIDRIFKLIKEDKMTNYYYVNMAKAWLISICFLKFKSKTLEFLNNNYLDGFTHNKTIQKIKESYRVTAEDKIKVNMLKR